MKKVVFALLVGFQLFVELLADTPANCTFDEIQGSWMIFEGPRGNTGSIDCENPDITAFTHQMRINFDFPNVVSDDFENTGTWTIIYNQGWEATINSRRYFAFSNYTTLDHHKVVSRCFETQIGWSHDVYVRDWSCFYAKKIVPSHMKKDRKHLKTHIDKSGFYPSTNNAIAESASEETDGDAQMYRNEQSFIDAINANQSSWRAAIYPEWEQYTLKQVVRRLGGVQSRIHRSKRTPALLHKSKHQQRRANVLPRAFDWRSVKGQNFVSPVRDQGQCGSCFAFASMAMLEARIRIQSNNTEQPVFSPQDVIECAQYAQGCDGGFAYLIAGKYAEDYGVVTEECNPYNPPEAGQPATCHTPGSCRRYYATDYHYVGGYYGATNEDLMKIALVKNGPMAVGLEVYDDFMQYKGGIYHHTGIVDKLNGLNKWNPFQITNHAVLLVGYGTDPTTNEAFWIVKNSWGPGWGESGFFRIRRGTDECAIESLAMESTPIPTY